mmetsp:Transcript_10741/g.32585  ORF Transcript_10741/g.32585 Transcript_10741/m.32585 type:complete len:141 (-) Transcript_10741:83-505(-)
MPFATSRSAPRSASQSWTMKMPPTATPCGRRSCEPKPQPKPEPKPKPKPKPQPQPNPTPYPDPSRHGEFRALVERPLEAALAARGWRPQEFYDLLAAPGGPAASAVARDVLGLVREVEDFPAWVARMRRRAGENRVEAKR